MKSIAAINKPKDRFYKNVSTLIKADLPINKKIQNLSTQRRASLATNALGSLNARLFAPTIKNKFCGFFRGTDSLAISNANLALGTGNFTIEFWLYRSSSAQNGIFSIGGDESDTGALSIMFSAAWSGSSVNKLTLDAAMMGNCTSNTLFSTNVWYHVAWVRTSVDSLSLYVNGYLDKTFTINSNYNFTKTAATIGKVNYTHTPDGFDGYIADFRIVKNQAIYLNPFSNPVSYLTPTENGGAFPSQRPIPSNVILMCLNNPLLSRDTSLSAQTITSTSSPLLIEFSASKTALGGLYATYFAGGSHVKLSSPSSSINIAAGNYTIDLWFYRSREGGVEGNTIVHFNNGSNGGTHIWITPGNQLMIDDGINPQTAFATTIPLYTWHHLAIVRNSTTTTAYLNGTSIGSNSYTPLINNQVTIGAYTYIPRYFFGGYIANFRVVVGQALYTANFSVPFHLTTTSTNGGATPSTAPTPANVVLLTLQDPEQGFYFLDRSSTPKALTYGGNYPETYELGAEYVEESRKTASNQNDLFSIETLPLSSLTFGTGISSYFVPDRLIGFAGATHTYIKSTDNKIFATGNNNLGQLGDGTFNNRDQFLEIPSLSNARMGSVGDAHSFVVKNDNTAWGVGRGEFGSIGNGTTTNRTTPIQVLTTTISAICGDNHTIFIRTDNSAWGTGWNNNGQLGITTGNVTGPFGDQINTAAAIPGMTNVRTASCGTYFTIFVKHDNTAWATGLNTNGQFGSVINGYTTPTQIMTNVKSVVCGPASTFFIKTDNTVWASGYNAQGQLGLGSVSENIWTPTQITSLSTSIKSIATGEYHTIFIKNDNTAWATGGADSFQLGNNSSNNVRTPVQIASDIDSATCGMYHTILKKIDGSILVVGSNLDGQLGARNNFTSLTSFTDTTNLFYLSKRLNYIPEYAGFFDIGSYLTIPTNNGFTLPGDFTIECWWKTPTTAAATSQNIWVLGNNFSTGLALYTTSSPNTLRFWTNNAILGTASTTTTQLDTWYHLAAVRSGSTLRLYTNGVPTITVPNVTTTFSTHTSNGFSIGTAFDGSFQGSTQPQYISNIRVVKGQALYTDTFNPPTSPLTTISNGDATPSIPPLRSNVSLLALHSSDVFLDTSSQPKNINRVGDVAMTSYQAASVVGKVAQIPASPWSISQGYYSQYFDGTTLATALSGGHFNFGTNDFTVEFWINTSVYSAETSVSRTILCFGADAVNTIRILLPSDQTGQISVISGAASTKIITGTIIVADAKWHHVALTRSGSLLKLFTDGQQSGSTATNTTNFNAGATALAFIGGYTSTTGRFIGHISNFRVTRNKALYTSSFTPSTIPLTLTSNGNALSSTLLPELKDSSFLGFNQSAHVSQGGPFLETTKIANFNNNWVYNSTLSQLLTSNDQAFTFECWYRSNGSTTSPCLFGHYTASNSGFSVRADGDQIRASLRGDPFDIIDSSTIQRGIWYHVAVSGKPTPAGGNGIKLFINGIQVGSTYTGSINMNNTSNNVIGNLQTSFNAWNVNASMTNVRFVRNQVLYTTNFSPPTVQLTTSSNGNATPSELPIPSNVIVLALQDSLLQDNSFSPKVLTVNGTSLGGSAIAPTFTSFSSYVPTVSFSTTNTSKIQPYNPFSVFKLQKTTYNSGYFNGTSYLTFSPNTVYAFDRDFTIEFWINTNTYSVDTQPRRIISLGTGADAANLLQMSLGASAASSNLSVYTTTGLINGTIPVADGSWHHVALVRNGTNLNLYIDGAQSGSTVSNNTTLFNAAATTNLLIGRYANGETGRFLGYITNIRIVNGVAVYTGAFTQPIAPVKISGISSTSSYSSLTNINTTFPSLSCALLLDFNNSGVVDSTGNTSIATFTDARISDLESKWSNKQSLYFDGSSQVTFTPFSPTEIGSKDFTVETWVWPVSTNYSYFFVDTRTSTSTNWVLGLDVATARKLFWYLGTNASGTYTSTSSNTLAYSAWNHIMYTRSNNVGNLYCNGVRVVSAADTNNYSTPISVGFIGSSNSSSNYFNGYLDDLRITNGTARATGATYTVPTRQAQTR